MPEIEEEVIGSHTEDDHTQDNSNEIPMDDVYKAFGIENPEEKKEEKAEDPAPAIEQKPEPKTIKVKHNKEEIEVDVSDDKLREYVQKSFALDKERERKSELEKDLDRAAKIAGFKSHEEFRANLDKIEQANTKAKEDAYAKLREELLSDLEYNGVDRQKAEQFIENHPLMQQARSATEEKQRIEEEREQQSIQQQWQSDWNELYDAFPDAKETAESVEEGKTPDWYTADMQEMIRQGYKPVHAYKLAHMDKIQAQTKKTTEQRLIKEQHLGLRSQVETVANQDNEPAIPDALAQAFAAFDLPAGAAKKYVKK